MSQSQRHRFPWLGNAILPHITMDQSVIANVEHGTLIAITRRHQTTALMAGFVIGHQLVTTLVSMTGSMSLDARKRTLVLVMDVRSVPESATLIAMTQPKTSFVEDSLSSDSPATRRGNGPVKQLGTARESNTMTESNAIVTVVGLIPIA